METQVQQKPHPAAADEPRVGVYVCQCGRNIAQTVDCRRVAEIAAGLPGVVLSKDITYACSTPGQQEIMNDINESGLDRVVRAIAEIPEGSPNGIEVGGVIDDGGANNECQREYGGRDGAGPEPSPVDGPQRPFVRGLFRHSGVHSAPGWPNPL